LFQRAPVLPPVTRMLPPLAGVLLHPVHRLRRRRLRLDEGAQPAANRQRGQQHQ